MASVTFSQNSVEGTVDLLVLLQSLRSPEERKLMAFIKNNGGPDKFLKDEKLMSDLIERSGYAPEQRDRKDQAKFLVDELATEVNKKLDDILQENRSVFDRKFYAQKQEFERALERQSKHIVSAISNAGPHSRVVDSVKLSFMSRIFYQH